MLRARVQANRIAPSCLILLPLLLMVAPSQLLLLVVVVVVVVLSRHLLPMIDRSRPILPLLLMDVLSHFPRAAPS